MPSPKWLSGAFSLVGAIATVQACNECEYAALLPAPACPVVNGAICQPQIQLIEVVVGQAVDRHCDVCAGRHHKDCSHCVTVVGPCPTPASGPVTTTIINNGITTVIIQTPTSASTVVPASASATASTASASSTSAASVTTTLNRSSSSPTPSASVAPVPFTCNTDAYVMAGADLYALDLVSGVNVTEIATNIGGNSAILAIGYNPLDNFIYGLSPVDRNGASQIVQIDSQGHQQFLGEIIYTPYTIGDFDKNGQLWVATSDNKFWAQIDLMPSSTTFGLVVNSGQMTPLKTLISDWAYIPSQNGFFSFGFSQTSNWSVLVQWTSYNQKFFERDIVLPGSLHSVVEWGPAFTNGRELAVADTRSGQIWKTIETSDNDLQQLGTSTLFGVFGPFGGARCQNAAAV